VEIARLGGLDLGLLLPVLADVSHAEGGERADQGARVELGDDDDRELVGFPARRASSVGDVGTHPFESFSKLGVGVGHFKKSGMSSESSSSSSNEESGCGRGGSGS